MSVRSYREAIRDALVEEMDRDGRVLLLGEDIALGGVFNVTPGLVERFGSERVIDTPISEMAFTGAAFGAAVCGLRPVVEIMFGDFLGLVLDTLCNQAAKYRFLSADQARVPLVVRSAVGAGGRFGAIHSQTPAGWLLGVPGLKLVTPATPADAKGMLKAAIRDDDPVVVFEHKLLYGRKGTVADDINEVVPLGRATLRRRGRDVTLAAASRSVEIALAAADELAEHGIEADVLDLRSLRPLDGEALAESAGRTGQLVVVEEGPPLGGYAAEVVALALELVGALPARRVTLPDLPIPFSPPLEDRWLPAGADVAIAARSLLGDSTAVVGRPPTAPSVRIGGGG